MKLAPHLFLYLTGWPYLSISGRVDTLTDQKVSNPGIFQIVKEVDISQIEKFTPITNMDQCDNRLLWNRQTLDFAT